MRTRRFGRTGMAIPEVVFGGGWVGGVLIHPEDGVRRAAFVKALDAGIDWIDTAASYGDGESERTIGRLRAELPAERRPRISTKARLDPASVEPVGDQLRRSLERSLERLRMDRVALFQLHNPIAPTTGGGSVAADAVLGADGVADALDRLRDEGLCDHLGFTALGDAASCIRVVESGRFDSAQVYLNMLNPTSGLASRGALTVQDFSGLLEACRRHDVGAMAIRVLAAGVLATDARHGREVPITAEGGDLSAEERRAAAALAAVGPEHGTRAQRALRFVLAEPRVSCAVVGMAELGHLDEALAGAAMGPLPEPALAALRAVWDRDFQS